MSSLAERSALGVWHGRWHGIAIATIAEQGLVRAHVGRPHSLSCGLAAAADISSAIQIFKTVEAGVPRLAGSIPVRLRYQPKRRCGATADGRGSREGPEVLTKF